MLAAVLAVPSLTLGRGAVAPPRSVAPRAAQGTMVAAQGTDERLRFLSEASACEVKDSYGTPAYVYSEAALKSQAETALAFPSAYGLTVRFAMKACPNAAVLQTFDRLGLHVDASSGYEVRRAVAAGVAPSRISLSSQETPADLAELLDLGIKFNACSLRQLAEYGRLRRGDRSTQLGVRFNPGLGSGGTGKTNVGGPSSSFGIWHELLPDVQALVEEHDLAPARVHTHIGSGSDPAVWQRVSGLSLDLCEKIPTVASLNLGGGYKVGRMAHEASTDLAVVGEPVKGAFEEFAARTGRQLDLEIEPGTFLVANSGCLVSTVQDIATTGADGHTFFKLDSGMTELLRPSLRAAPGRARHAAGGEYVIVGHCCESGDLVTPAPDEPETLSRRHLGGDASIGDLVVVEGGSPSRRSGQTRCHSCRPPPRGGVEGPIAVAPVQGRELGVDRWR
ncbi:hypothetical protein EMIHUDRAFT_438904 [Emiliania huxleyi CCMP1516]|uniref:Diaminopimelate decarboxylase n=2 Tax=Emiliania huxleyi TaxID=2903 RepID=A0A0D3I3F8_EMIH1|nr:hypothetical protein EMIHUDRAFT_438904 [Emiliania huxleyi CCMP1516]EOD05793.1 hypothetical protein EMIHUDRAFT_438904 [Emiliania huxleyi CCMP1516]|eukprot:XP_005758222.1 hypothetical protein EMIHUDRAFT_438904 [Emiliania huxleyi CCMP1516]